jgi:hypothetical protein
MLPRATKLGLGIKLQSKFLKPQRGSCPSSEEPTVSFRMIEFGVSFGLQAQEQYIQAFSGTSKLVVLSTGCPLERCLKTIMPYPKRLQIYVYFNVHSEVKPELRPTGLDNQFVTEL